MKKIFALLSFFLLLNVSATAEMDKSLLLMESKVFPKIIMLDKNLPKKVDTASKTITIHVYYDKGFSKEAEAFASLMKKNFYGYNVKTLLSPRVLKSVPTAYVIVGSKQYGMRVFDKIKNNKRIVFSLYPNGVSYSVVTLQIGMKVVPLLNAKNLKIVGVEFNPIIYKVAKFYEN